MLGEIRTTRVVIATGHRNHDTADNSPANLAAWCQRCHTVASLSLPALAADGATSVRLPDTSRFPESVTADANGTLFVSSPADGGVLKVDADGAVMSQFLNLGEHGTRSTFGLLADPKRGVLWVASNDATPLGAKGPTGTEGAWVKAFDVATGAMKTSVRLSGAKTLANDFALDGHGSLYVTNTFAPHDLAPWCALDLKLGSVDEETDDEEEPVQRRADHRHPEGATGRATGG